MIQGLNRWSPSLFFGMRRRCACLLIVSVWFQVIECWAYTPRPVVMIHGRIGVGEDNQITRAFLQSKGIPAYAFSMSDNEGAIANWGKELGDRDYRNPAAGMSEKCWFDKLQETVSFDKAILIGFSTGGLAAREYVTSTYYGGDVERIITYNTPHNGSQLGLIK